MRAPDACTIPNTCVSLPKDYGVIHCRLNFVLKREPCLRVILIARLHCRISSIEFIQVKLRDCIAERCLTVFKCSIRISDSSIFVWTTCSIFQESQINQTYLIALQSFTNQINIVHKPIIGGIKICQIRLYLIQWL